MALPPLPVPVLLLGAGLVAMLVVVLIARPGLLLRFLVLPVVWFFAGWTYLKTILLLPVNVHEWLVASALEKNASALASHAAAASALWGANSEFRPAAREIYGRVCAGYGVFPARAGTLHEDEGLLPMSAGRSPPGEDPYDAINRASAAQAVTRSRGGLKPVEKAPPAAPESPSEAAKS